LISVFFFCDGSCPTLTQCSILHVLDTNPASFCTPPPQSCINCLSLPPSQPKNPTRTSSPRTKAYVHAVLPELHQHLSCVVCLGSFAHVAFGLGLFARVAFVRADSAESQVRPVVGPVVCLRGHRPAKFSSARALTHHPRRWRLGMRGGLFFSLSLSRHPKMNLRLLGLADGSSSLIAKALAM